MNKNDRNDVVKTAEQKGYSWNSDNSKMINGNGGSLKFSATGGSVNLNGSSYNSSSDTKKSKSW